MSDGVQRNVRWRSTPSDITVQRFSLLRRHYSNFTSPSRFTTERPVKKKIQFLNFLFDGFVVLFTDLRICQCDCIHGGGRVTFEYCAMIEDSQFLTTPSFCREKMFILSLFFSFLAFFCPTVFAKHWDRPSINSWKTARQAALRYTILKVCV